MAGAELLTETQRHLEALCLGLRTREGITLADLTPFSPGSANPGRTLPGRAAYDGAGPGQTHPRRFFSCRQPGPYAK